METAYRKVCETIVAAGGTPFPVTNTLVEIVKRIVSENEIEVILGFTEKKSQTLEQLLETTHLSEDEILKKIDNLAGKGVIFNQPNRSGVMVYRLLPFVNVGIFEYTFMQKLTPSRENRELADLFQQLFSEVRGVVQKSYDQIVGFMEHMPPVDRTVPMRLNMFSGNPTIIEIDEHLEATVDRVLQTTHVAGLIEKFDEIAVGHCFCRQHKDIIEQPCRQTEIRESCFTFGKSARFTTEQGFMRMIDKKEALEILLQAEKDGLVHKAYHPNFDVNKDETSVCNCCKCCCGNSIENQIGPIVNATNFLAVVSPQTCVGCGDCRDRCHVDAIALNEMGVSEVDPGRCIGCGVCACFCPEDAIRLHESNRIVRIAPARE
ncbi:4Fe-4S binding protein [bacterium]|nr:4Fe-4S binding protein [bacterium]